MTDRTVGLLGRRPPKHAPALRLAHFLTGVVPAHPASQDNLAALHGGWQMLGNDAAGDCVAVTWANFRRLMTRGSSYPSQADVWAVYGTQNPGFVPGSGPNGYGSEHDRGMDIQTLLEYLVTEGGPDGVKAVAFAKVDLKNMGEVEAALAIFGGLWTGIDVLAANQDEFAAGRPWDWTNSPVEGGHSVLSGGYLGNKTNDVQFITWAAETGFTDRYWAVGVEEAWVVIWPEHLGTTQFQQGVDLAALASAYTSITGRPFPDAPTPAPTPAPGPAPAPAGGFPPVVRDWLGQHHTGHTATVAAALKQYVTQHNL